MIYALHGGCELQSTLWEWLCGVHAGELRGGPCSLALGADKSACGKRMWKNISAVGVRSRHSTGLRTMVLYIHHSPLEEATEEVRSFGSNPRFDTHHLLCAGLLAIIELSKPWFSCEISVLVLSLCRGWTNECLSM